MEVILCLLGDTLGILELSLKRYLGVVILCISLLIKFYSFIFCIVNGKKLVLQCDPYFDDTGCSHPGCEPEFPTPKCVRKCVDGNQLWRQSKHYSASTYRISSEPENIMAELYKNGPVEVSFTVFEVNEIQNFFKTNFKFLWGRISISSIFNFRDTCLLLKKK